MDLAAYRLERGLTQTELAVALGLRSKGYISRIESGREVCPPKLALKIQRWSGGKVLATKLNPAAAELLNLAGDAAAAAGAAL